MSAPWVRYLLGAGVLTIAELLLPVGLARDLVYLAVAALTVVAVVVGVRIHRPATSSAWMLMAAGIACWTVGDAMWAYFAHVGIDPYPSLADVMYLAGYPLLTIALYRMARAVSGKSGRAAVIDPLIVAVGAGLLLWVGFIEPTWTDPEGDLLTRAVGISYPLGDIVLLTLVVHLGVMQMQRSRSARLLGAGVVVVLVADVLFQAAAYIPLIDQHVLLIDAPWLAAYLLWGVAALHPSVAARPEPRTMVRAATVTSVAFLAVAVLVLPLLIIVESILGLPQHTEAVSVAAVAMVGLVLVRMVDLVHHLHDQAARLEALADTDVATGLENRRRFTERIDAMVTGPAGVPAALLLVAIERFAEINETLGDRTGDELMRAVGVRLTEAVDIDGVVARTGAETFGILLPRVGSGEAAARRAHEIRAVFDEPFALSELTLSFEGAVGIALAPSDATHASDLLHRADTALSSARGSRDRVARFAGQMANDGSFTPQLMTELRQAIEAKDLVLHYQPQVELGTGRVLGVEALVRWDHPTLGMLPPIAFVPAAERTGLIRLLTMYVLDTGIAQAAQWRDEGLVLTLAVNLSVRDLLDPSFVQDVEDCLERHSYPASALELEVTETMAMVDPNRSLEVLGALAGLGVTLSVDDYGTGYSSLAYLQRLPLHRLKIDRSFVSGVVTDGASAAIVRSTIELARHLGLDVVAEGVEDDPTLLALLDMRCFAAQGYGLGRPVPVDRLPGLVAEIEGRLPTLVGAQVPGQRAVPVGPSAPDVTLTPVARG